MLIRFDKWFFFSGLIAIEFIDKELVVSMICFDNYWSSSSSSFIGDMGLFGSMRFGLFASLVGLSPNIHLLFFCIFRVKETKSLLESFIFHYFWSINSFCFIILWLRSKLRGSISFLFMNYDGWIENLPIGLVGFYIKVPLRLLKRGCYLISSETFYSYFNFSRFVDCFARERFDIR